MAYYCVRISESFTNSNGDKVEVSHNLPVVDNANTAMAIFGHECGAMALADLDRLHEWRFNPEGECTEIHNRKVELYYSDYERCWEYGVYNRIANAEIWTSDTLATR